MSTPLVLYCAAGVQVPIDQLVSRYEADYGVSVQVQYGGSGTLLAGLALHAVGDVYLAADERFMDRAVEDGFVDDRYRIAKQSLVIASAEGNPMEIATLADLVRPGLRLGLANPEQTAAGWATRALLAESEQWEAFRDHARVFKPSVTDLLNDLVIGSLDAAILWDATAAMRKDLATTSIPGWSEQASYVEIGVMRRSTQRERAEHFAAYLQTQVPGREAFVAAGFSAVELSE